NNSTYIFLQEVEVKKIEFVLLLLDSTKNVNKLLKTLKVTCLSFVPLLYVCICAYFSVFGFNFDVNFALDIKPDMVVPAIPTASHGIYARIGSKPLQGCFIVCCVSEHYTMFNSFVCRSNYQLVVQDSGQCLYFYACLIREKNYIIYKA
ncbi:hypothetical protein ACJX0J_036624, partial [Zea mays]